MTTPHEPDHKSFLASADKPARGMAGEFIDLLRHNKKWWLAPLLIVLLAIGGLVILGGTAAAPFIYTLF